MYPVYYIRGKSAEFIGNKHILLTDILNFVYWYRLSICSAENARLKSEWPANDGPFIHTADATDTNTW